MEALNPVGEKGGRWLAGLFILFFVPALCACSSGGHERLKIGDQAPLFKARDLTGNQVSMASYRGNPVILRFWSVNCKYCRADTPIFNSYFNKYKEKGLKVVYINTNPEAARVGEFVRDLDIPFPVVIDADGGIAADYNIKMVPQTVIIDPGQKIIAAILGGVSEVELKGLLGRYLQENDNE